MIGFKGLSFTTIRTGQVAVGDIIHCRGQYLEIYAFGDDSSYVEGVHDAIRLKKDLTKNINKQKFEIIKWPRLVGQLFCSEDNPNCSVSMQEPVLFNFAQKKKQSNIGSLNIVFKNACFNRLGLLTHDS
uniref:Uncharacterized protein n=1 Tax=Clytia hemisphaerica TaxID=252671 RepID=A0A7M5XIE2_9CNID